MTWRFRPSSSRRRDWRFPPTTSWDCRKEFRPTRTIFSRASAWPGIPAGDGKTVVRASYGIFYDHPLLGLYFLGDASDGSSSGQLAFAGTSVCSGAGQSQQSERDHNFPGSADQRASPANPVRRHSQPGHRQRTGISAQPAAVSGAELSAVRLSQPELSEPAPTFLPLGFQPFGYPQSKNFVYAYSQQANLSVERDLGGGFALSLAYNFNGGRHLNRPINANTIRGDLMVDNFNAATRRRTNSCAALSPSDGCSAVRCGTGPLGPWVNSALMNFFRPGGLNPSIAGALIAPEAS